ncbi:hypothetical protein CHS0354_034037 [Potamilus streckersoni]|uniref:Uncharacterized protein n=1 Tax=Potamilus streckersoni TaxID=2493646 RepID=A0AAE0RMV2_9BIVA|nr:hypothetical protein CHS0354_034037 [Potamilus streckersoni]
MSKHIPITPSHPKTIIVFTSSKQSQSDYPWEEAYNYCYSPLLKLKELKIPRSCRKLKASIVGHIESIHFPRVETAVSNQRDRQVPAVLADKKLLALDTERSSSYKFTATLL